ncbi:MAG: 50S ribosomal protein L9 [Candidatus Omnitrophica bacterium]|nr:50S ribosomal protein L9 [Candidatus Omnitrophota bacterium]
MKVILRTGVANLGEAGELKEVAGGFARNFLLPRKLAYPASKASEKQVAEEYHAPSKLKDVSLTLQVTVGSEEQLYGSVSERDIVTALAAEYQIELEAKAIKLAEPIKQLGVYKVPVRLSPEVESTITVWVVKNSG